MILVTGASGALGAHLARRLLVQGHEVVSIEHDAKPYDTARLLGIKDKIIWARGTITDQLFLKRVLSDYNIDCVFHLAALPIVQAGMRSCSPAFDVNLMGTVQLLDAIREVTSSGKQIKLMYVSTDKVYGDVGRQPYTENMPLEAFGIYECSKAGADLAVRAYASCGFIPHAVVVRPCNFLIPADINFERVLPRLIIPCLRGEAPTLYRTSHLREYLYVDDAIDAFLALMTVPLNARHFEVFNVGSGHQSGLEETTNAVLQHFPGIPTPTWIETPKLARQVEIPFQRLDSAKLHAATGWFAKTSFVEGVDKVVEWWRTAWDRLPASIRNWRVKDWHG